MLTKNHLLCILVAIVLVPMCVPAFCQDVIYKDDFESRLDTNVQIQDVEWPFKIKTLGLTTERAHSGSHSVKIDFSTTNAFNVFLAPRSLDKPVVNYGQIGGVGSFSIPGLGIPLRSDRGYMLEAWVWVEEASPDALIRLGLETEADSLYGPRLTTYVIPGIPNSTGGWIKIEQELSSLIMDRADASGDVTNGLKLNSIMFCPYFPTGGSVTVYIDDVSIREVPVSVVNEWKSKDPSLVKPPAEKFAHIPSVEDQFIWGTYGDLQGMMGGWFRKVDPAKDARTQQIKQIEDYGDWLLLDLRRHYCNTLVQGGGMIIAGEGQTAFDYVKAALDKCGEYGVKLAPSTYVSRHYNPAMSVEDDAVLLNKTADSFSKHPALFAYWLVDEPGGESAQDFFLGKKTLETRDPMHPALSALNSIDNIKSFAPILPLVCIDYYPVSPTASVDPGPWAVGDSARYARMLGASRIWMLPQAFGSVSWRAATPEEYKIQVFSSMAEGASGFFPYDYAQSPAWTGAFSESGNLVDIFGNSTPIYQWMKEIGPYIRSAGALLVGAKRLSEDEAVVQTIASASRTISNVGRVRPSTVARVFKDDVRNVRYVVVYNNTDRYSTSGQLALKQLGADEKLLDMFALKETPVGGTNIPLNAGDGRIYAIGTQSALDAVKDEVYKNRIDIEKDLLTLEIKLAGRMGGDVNSAKSALAETEKLVASSQYPQALKAVLFGLKNVYTANRENRAYSLVNGNIECARASLGNTGVLLNRKIGSPGFAKDDPQVKGITDRLVPIADKFYRLQNVLIQKGPKGMGQETARLRLGAEALERDAVVLLGM